jgi:hypothetical protein
MFCFEFKSWGKENIILPKIFAFKYIQRNLFGVVDQDTDPHGFASFWEAGSASASEWKQDPSPYQFQKPDPYPHQDPECCGRSQCRRRALKWVMVADSNHFDEDQDPDPDPHHTMKSDWIHYQSKNSDPDPDQNERRDPDPNANQNERVIRIRIKLKHIRNTDLTQNSALLYLNIGLKQTKLYN